jgi:hypothetical protein
MFLKIEIREQGSTRPSMTLEMCKILDQSPIKYDQIAPVTRRIWEIIFFSQSAANQALSNVLLSQKGFLIWIPWTIIYRKGIIREIRLDCIPLEIKEELNRTNPNLNVIDVTRMKRKEKKDGKATWVDTFSICITARNKELPNYVYLWRARLGRLIAKNVRPLECSLPSQTVLVKGSVLFKEVKRPRQAPMAATNSMKKLKT